MSRVMKYVCAGSFGAVIGLAIIGLVTVLGGTVIHTWAIIACPMLTAMFAVLNREENKNG
jgi:hypothetical protein